MGILHRFLTSFPASGSVGIELLVGFSWGSSFGPKHLPEKGRFGHKRLVSKLLSFILKICFSCKVGVIVVRFRPIPFIRPTKVAKVRITD